MDVLAITILVSSCLAGIFVVCFAIEARCRGNSSFERDSLLPLDSKTPDKTPPLNVFPTSHPMTTTITYDNRTVRRFMTASIFWGIIGMLVGVLAATQLSWWQMNGKFLETITFGLIKSEGLSYITYGRIRPLHTNAVIFACVGNMVFAGVYYSTQRLCRCRIASDLLSTVHFWGWQSIILGAAIPLLLNFASQLGKHAEKLARGNSPTNFRREELAKTGTLQP